MAYARSELIKALLIDTAGNPYTASSVGSSGWIDDGTIVRLTTASDNVGIGTATALSGAKVSIDGGGIKWTTDNTYDLGASGANRPRTGYFGTSVITPAATISNMTAGSVLFAGTGGAVTQDNTNLFWNDTTNRLGIGTASPGYQLDISNATSPQLGLTRGSVSGVISVDSSNRLVVAPPSANDFFINSGALRLNPGDIKNLNGAIVCTFGASGFTTFKAQSVQVGMASTDPLRFIVEGNIELNSGDTTVIALRVRGKASQSASLQEWQNSAATVLSKVNASGDIVSGTNDWALVTSNGGLQLASDNAINFSSTTAYTGTKDVGLERDSAGVLEVTNGSTGSAELKANGIVLPLDNDAVTPTIRFGDGDSGFYESADDVLQISIAGTSHFRFQSSQFGANNNDRAAILNADATATIPVFIPSQLDTNTGIGRAAADQLSLIAGGVEGIRITTNATSTLSTLNGTLAAATGDEYALNIAYTTNKATSGDDYGLRISQTDTASPGTSYLLWAGIGATSKFNVSNTGAITIDGSGGITLAGGGSIFLSSNRSLDGVSNNDKFNIHTRNMADAGTVAVTMCTGTQTQTSGSCGAVQITPTYNQTSGTAANTDLLINRTQTAVGSGAQLLIDLQVGGSSKFKVTNDGIGTFVGDGVSSSVTLGSPSAAGIIRSGNSGTEALVLISTANDVGAGDIGLVIRNSANLASNDYSVVFDNNNGASRVGALSMGGIFSVLSTGQFGFSSTTSATGALDTSLGRNAAGVVEVNNGTLGTYRWLTDAGRKMRTATQTVTDSTTLTNDDTLSISVLAGRKYHFRVEYYYTTVATSGVKVDLGGGTATFTSFQGSTQITNLETYGSEGGLGGGEMTAATTALGVTVTGTVTKVIMEGAFQCNAAGTIIPRFAQNLETVAAESVIAKVGSTMILTDIP